MQNIVIQNVVALTELETTQKLDLRLIAAKIEGARFNPKRFPGVILRKTKPRGTAMVFKSGKIIILGCESEKQSEIVAHKVTKDIGHALNNKFSIRAYRITNIIASCSLGSQINIGRLADQSFGVKDDNFSGLVYKMGEPIKTALIFHSGKIVMCGARDQSSLEKAYIILKSRLEPYLMLKKEIQQETYDA